MRILTTFSCRVFSSNRFCVSVFLLVHSNIVVVVGLKIMFIIFVPFIHIFFIWVASGRLTPRCHIKLGALLFPGPKPTRTQVPTLWIYIAYQIRSPLDCLALMLLSGPFLVQTTVAGHAEILFAVVAVNGAFGFFALLTNPDSFMCGSLRHIFIIFEGRGCFGSM